MHYAPIEGKDFFRLRVTSSPVLSWFTSYAALADLQSRLNFTENGDPMSGSIRDPCLPPSW